MHHGALAGGVREDAPRHVAKGCFGQAAFDGVIQFQDGRDGLAQDAATAEECCSLTWVHSVSV
jgi:hypothetical protein